MTSLEPTLSKIRNNEKYHTRGARGEAKLNRTLEQSPRHRLAEPRRTPKKNVPCFSDLCAPDFFF